MLTIAEALYTCETATLAWDSTSLTTGHFNEVHVALRHAGHPNITEHAAVDGLKKISSTPCVLIESPTDAFSRRFHFDDAGKQKEDKVLTILRQLSFSGFEGAAQRIADAACVILKRQLQRYLDGDLSTPSDNVKVMCSSAQGEILRSGYSSPQCDLWLLGSKDSSSN